LFRGFFAQSRVQSSIEVRRWLRRLPFIEQRHCLTELAKHPRALGAGSEMGVDLRRGSGKPGGQVRKLFANFNALHGSFPSPNRTV
jgi:hypothetical protein